MNKMSGYTATEPALPTVSDVYNGYPEFMIEVPVSSRYGITIINRNL